MAFKEIQEKKPKYINELPKDVWVTGKLLEIKPGTPGKHSNQYTLEMDKGEKFRFYGCSKIDNSIDSSYLNKMVRFMYRGKTPTETGFQYNVGIQVDYESGDLSNATDAELASALENL